MDADLVMPWRRARCSGEVGGDTAGMRGAKPQRRVGEFSL